MTQNDGRVGFGMIGLGVGLQRCEMMQKAPEARLVAVADLNEKRASETAARFGVEWYTDYHRLLDRDDIEVVGVYTPSGLHQDIALDVARAGKHVLTTKPMEITLERVDQIIAGCAKAGVKLATEFGFRYSPSNWALYKAIQDGQLGRLILGEFDFKCHRTQEYYGSDGGWRGTWKLDGGGAIMNQTIHSVDQMLWMMGDVESVNAHWGTYTHCIETEDTAVALLKFRNGALGVLLGTTTFLNDRPAARYGATTQRIEVSGEFGSATLIDNKTTMWIMTKDKDTPATLDPPAVNIFQDYARWVRDDNYSSPTLSKNGASRKTVELILAIYESARTGKTVTFAQS